MWIDSCRFQSMFENRTLLWLARVNGDYTGTLQNVTLIKPKGNCNNIDIHLRLFSLGDVVRREPDIIKAAVDQLQPFIRRLDRTPLLIMESTVRQGITH